MDRTTSPGETTSNPYRNLIEQGVDREIACVFSMRGRTFRLPLDSEGFGVMFRICEDIPTAELPYTCQPDVIGDAVPVSTQAIPTYYAFEVIRSRKGLK